MELKINSIIKAHTKVSYAIESAGPRPYDIDCAEGTNIVSYSPSAEEAFNELKFEMLHHAAKSPNYYFLFQNLKKWIGGEIFYNMED